MATGAQALAVNYPTQQVIEATTPEVVRNKSVSGDYGINERAYGITARVTPGVTFEEYVHWAKIEREMEDEENRKYKAGRGPLTFAKMIKGRFSHGVHHENKMKEEKEEEERRSRALQAQEESHQFNDDKNVWEMKDVSTSPPPDVDNMHVTDAEWRTAARALRTASWGTIFFLVTTDILGWSGCP